MTLSLSAFSALTLVCCITCEERAIYLRRRTCANNDENNYVPRAKSSAYNGAPSQEWGSRPGFLCLQTRLLNRVATTHFELLPLPFSSDCCAVRELLISAVHWAGKFNCRQKSRRSALTQKAKLSRCSRRKDKHFVLGQTISVKTYVNKILVSTLWNYHSELSASED